MPYANGHEKIKKQHKLKKSTARPNLDWNRKDLRI